VPYPGYRFGDIDNLDLKAKLRLNLWKTCRRTRPGELAVRCPWHDDLQVLHHLGNDLSLCAYVGGCFEPNETYFVGKFLRPGMVFIDVGANEGLYSLLAARRVGPAGRVIAVEPSHRELARLRRNIALNDLRNIEVLPVALLDGPSEVSLRIADPEHAGQNTVGSVVYPGVSVVDEIEVMASTLDSVMYTQGLEKIDLIKVDAEGAEVEILAGGTDMLSRHRPVLLLEMQESSLQARGTSTATLLGKLRALDYEVFDFDETTGELRRAETPVGGNVVARPAR
jgi:FkbM family methyltransferase